MNLRRALVWLFFSPLLVLGAILIVAAGVLIWQALAPMGWVGLFVLWVSIAFTVAVVSGMSRE